MLEKNIYEGRFEDEEKTNSRIEKTEASSKESDELFLKPVQLQ